jgi:hypothetical protein
VDNGKGYLMGTNSRAWAFSSFFALSSLLLLNAEVLSEDPSNKKGAAAEKVEKYDWKPFVPDSNLDLPWESGQRQRFIPSDQRNADFSGKNLPTRSAKSTHEGPSSTAPTCGTPSSPITPSSMGLRSDGPTSDARASSIARA